MYAIKFDVKKVKKSIESFYDMYERYPYLICSTETRKIIPPEKIRDHVYPPAGGWTINGSYMGSVKMCIDRVSIDGKDFINEDSLNKTNDIWYGSTILIDDNLKFGEIRIV